MPDAGPTEIERASCRIFSTYNNTYVVSNQGRAEIVGNCSPHNISEAVKIACPNNMKPSSDASPMKQGKYTNHDDNMPSLGLSMKRARSTGNDPNAIQKEKMYLLRPSDMLAFKSYNTSIEGRVGGLVGSYSPHGNSSEAVKTGYPYNMKPSSDASMMQQGKDMNHDDNMPLLELSSKRPRSTGDGPNAIHEEKTNILRPSDLSAFTSARYNTSYQGGVGRLVGSCSPHDNNSEAGKMDCPYNMMPSSDACPMKRGKDVNRDDNMTSLVLSLKRSRSTGYYANAIQKATKNVLRQHYLPALTRIFSRYNNMHEVSNHGGAGIVGSCLPHNSSEAVKTACPYNMKPSSYASLMKQGKDTNRDDNMRSLELSMKRPRSTRDGANAIQKENMNVLIPSDLSALPSARYNTSNQGGVGGLVGSYSQYGNSSKAVKTGCPYNMKPSLDASMVQQGKDTIRDDNMSSLELSSKRPRSTRDGPNATQEEKKNVLRPSDLLAFTRYNASNIGGAGGLVGRCSLHGNISETVETGCPYKMKSSSDAGAMKQGSNGSSNNNMGSTTTTNVVTKPGGNKISPITDKADEVGKKKAVGGKDKAGEAQSRRPCAVHDENGGSTGVPQSNVSDPWAPVEGSNSGSYNNTNNGSTTAAAVNTRTTGLNRYREKKKMRNFANMLQVRYEGRKIQAEQRPRVRGQFARQAPPAATASER